MNKFANYLKKSLGRTLLLLLLLFLAACGGGEENGAVESVEESGPSEADDTTDSEAIEDGNIEATGSEEDSGEIPPTPNPGSKVDAPRATPVATGSALIAADEAPQANRVESEETAVPPALDLVLLIDVTGSMANELAQLQTDLADLLTTLATLPEITTLRLGLATYRDQSKLDAVQIFALTEDIALFSNQIEELTAVGGGDYPEALNEGLYQAVSSLDWHPESIKLLLILGDAPPQTATTNVPTYEQTSTLAAEQNITISTIGSDGLNATGITVFAQIAQIGNGRFYFISDNLDNNVNGATAVYPTSQLTTLIFDIVQEGLNAQVP